MKKAFATTLGLALALALAADAHAQGGPPPGGPGAGPRTPPPAGANPFAGPRFPARGGLTFGVGGGLGGMETRDVVGLGDDGIAGAIYGHVGWMLTPQLALGGDVFIAFQNTGSSIGAGDVFLTQSAGFVTLQFWPTPQLWLKGGLGGAVASLSDDAGFIGEIGTGDGAPALLLALGYEVLHAPRFAIDVEFRFASATYNGVADERISQGILGVGFSWFLTPVIGVGATAY